VIEGQSDDDAVKKAQEHAKANHGMDLSREQALSMAPRGLGCDEKAQSSKRKAESKAGVGANFQLALHANL
jgi:hypothetical protein